MKKIAAFIMLIFHQNTGFKRGKPGMLDVYWAPVDAILTQPEPPATGTLAGETAEATGAWAFKEDGDGFIKMGNNLLEGSALKYTAEGDKSSPADKTTMEFRVDGLDSELIERFRDMKGVPGVYVLLDNQCPEKGYIVVGCACGWVYTTPSFDSDKVGGSAGKKWMVTADGACAPYVWIQGEETLPLKTLTGESAS